MFCTIAVNSRCLCSNGTLKNIYHIFREYHWSYLFSGWMAKFDACLLVQYLSPSLVTPQIIQGLKWEGPGPGTITPVPQTASALSLEQACIGTVVWLLTSSQQECGWIAQLYLWNSLDLLFFFFFLCSGKPNFQKGSPSGGGVSTCKIGFIKSDSSPLCVYICLNS